MALVDHKRPGVTHIGLSGVAGKETGPTKLGLKVGEVHTVA